MGATTFTMTAKGNDVKEVFNDLVEEALRLYGDNRYNGKISTTSLANEIRLPKEVQKSKNKNKAINELLMEDDNFGFIHKWETRYADLGVVHYESYIPKWVADARKPKIEKGVRTERKFSVVKKQNNTRTKTYQARNIFPNITKAKKYAKEQALKTGEEFTIMQHRSNEEMFQVGHMNLIADGKTYKTPRKLKTKAVKPVNEFIFFVYAAT